MNDISQVITRLSAGSDEWSRQPPASRAELAVRTAMSVAESAGAWVEAAVAIKQADSLSQDSTVVAEETATGPLATLRLLLVTARALADVASTGLPSLARQPRLLHPGSDAARVAVDVVPARGPGGSLHDAAIFAGHRATVRCVAAGGLETFMRSWREEVHRRPSSGGVALVLGAGNVTGLAAADCVSQIFEHGRAVFLKLHPLHEPLLPVFRRALEPLVDAGVLAIHAGGTEMARAVLADPAVGHVHLTGGAVAYDALVWGGGDRTGRPALRQAMTCELGNVTPWFILPGRYTPQALARQADLVAASIINNTSFNCIATKLVVTSRSWEQREAFLDLARRRLAAAPPRRAWYPGSVSAWESIAGQAAPSDGTLPWCLREGIDPREDSQFVGREWFVPVAAEIPLAADSIEAYCVAVHDLVASLPGSLAASVTLPGGLAGQDAARAELLIEHLPFGTVAVNTWSALGYAMGSVPWGGFPGGTLADPKSGIGFVHDPLLLPLVHNTILRAPLCPSLAPAWLPWHPHAAALARGLMDVYGSIARGGRGLWPLMKMLPTVLTARA
jgi:acyl-CoA reductase-like NAD-dependent aldehyde dehydrogenase